MTNALPLVPVADPDVQFNLDQIALAIGSLPIMHERDTAGGDLTGTYPNPTIGTAKVTVAKTATGIFLELLTTGTSRKAAFSAGTLHFAASATSDTLTVTHSLGVVPQIVLCTGTDFGDGRFLSFGVKNTGTTTFQVTAKDWAGGSVTKDQTFYWLAIG